MAATAEQRDSAVERDMSAHQRGIVDTCLEESQFESAIAVMEQLRSSNYKPPIAHIRQLVYIALQPVDPSSAVEMNSYTDAPPSPSKTAVKKSIPSGAAISAAQRLLISYALTNSPETIARALPHCDDPRNQGSVLDDDGSLESVIGPESMCIPRAKSCWNILADGFTQQQKHTIPVPQGKGRKRIYNLEEPIENLLIENAIVGKNSWPVLDWLLVLFEQDELVTKTRGLGRFSNLLLQQIPCPRSGNGARWDTEVPLRVVFFCLDQLDLRRRMMGSRLMTLLINLSSTTHLDLPMFVASVFSRLTASELEKLPVLFSSLGPTPAVHRFKVALCQKFLSDTNDAYLHGGRPKAQVRAQPRARPMRADVPTDKISSKPVSTNTAPSSNKYPLPDYTEVHRLMETNTAAQSSILITASLQSRIKFEFMNSYGTLQSEALPSGKDAEWLASLHNGMMGKTIDLAFESADDVEESRIFRESLRGIMSTW